MILATILVHLNINKTFVTPSITLALTNARIIDEQNIRRQELSKKYQEYKAAKREKRRREARDNMNKNKNSSSISNNNSSNNNNNSSSLSQLGGQFKADEEGNVNFHHSPTNKSYIPTSLMASSSSPSAAGLKSSSNHGISSSIN